MELQPQRLIQVPHSENTIFDEYLQRSFRASGGAGGTCTQFIQECTSAKHDNLEIFYQGTFRQPDQYNFIFWGTKNTDCRIGQEELHIGDMAYFAVRGGQPGEVVLLTIIGPDGQTWKFDSVIKEQAYLSFDTCDVSAKKMEARFGWAVMPDMPLGIYQIRASGRSGTVEMRVQVSATNGPTFGVQFPYGPYGDPSSYNYGHGEVEPGGLLEIGYAGFEAEQTITTIIYYRDQDQLGSFVNAWKINLDNRGEARAILQLPSDLLVGSYALVVPEAIPSGGDMANGALFFRVIEH